MLSEHKRIIPMLKKAGLKKEASRQSKELKKIKKMKLTVNNKMKGKFGQMDPNTNKIEINLKEHKKNGKIDKAELASTIKHEMLHVKHPKMTEKEVYKKSLKSKISKPEETKLIKKLNMKKSTNYKVGSLKRKFKINKSDKIEPGTFINKANESKKNLAIKGLI